MVVLDRMSQALWAVCLGVCVFCLGVITIALSAQITARYVFNIPLHYTDDFAEISLVWLAFLGAAVLFREGTHISITALPDILSAKPRAALRMVIAVMAACALALVLKQVWQVAPIMTRVTYGSLPTIPFFSKFVALFMPLGLSAAITIFFAVVEVVRDIHILTDNAPPDGPPTPEPPFE